jgi:hypothetical protein
MIQETTNVAEEKMVPTHSFAVVHRLSHTDTGQTMRFSEQDAPISQVNVLPPAPSAVMVYSETLLHFPENCCTPKLISFSVR